MGAVVAMLAAGCGGEKKDTDADRAGATVERYLGAVSDGDHGRACEQLTPQARQGLAQVLVLLRPDPKSAVAVVTGSQDCRHLSATLRRFLDRAGRLDDLQGKTIHADVRKGGRTALVRYRAGRLTTTWPLEQLGGKWRITEVALGTVKKEEEGEGGESEGSEK